ncbi:hypothetical protein HYR99_41495 [Candidatus Poribacteria bacterium]|nr:hypothetical protein [Candidatus Poribacteria bacterium]
MSKSTLVARYALPLLWLLVVGCADNIPDPLTKTDVEGMLGPALIQSDPSEGSAIQPTSQIIFTFNKTVSEVTVNGRPAQISGKQATFQGDIGNGDLLLVWKWPHGMDQRRLRFIVDAKGALQQ